MQAPNAAQAPASPSLPGQVIVKPGADVPNAVYKAFNAQRQELHGQLEQLEDKRRSLTQQLQNAPAAGAVNRAGIETRIVELDKHIADMDKEIALADQNVAKAAAVPGAVIPPPPFVRNGPPDEAWVLGGLFIVLFLFPLSLAFTRRIWKRGAVAVTAFPQELSDRLNRLDHAVDSIAVEVERIGEGQRFVTRVMSENGRALGSGAALPIDLGARGEKANAYLERDRGTQ